MKKLNLEEMKNFQGGKLTQQEIDDFLGAAGCTATLFGGPFAIFGAGSCLRWIWSL